MSVRIPELVEGDILLPDAAAPVCSTEFEGSWVGIRKVYAKDRHGSIGVLHSANLVGCDDRRLMVSK